MENQVRSYAEAVQISVNWWAEKAFNTPLNQNNGDDSEQGGIAFMLMNMLSSSVQQEITPQKIEAFKSKLTELLLAKEGKENLLHVDYHPNAILGEACDFAGIDVSCLPCKTNTSINKNNQVEGRYQYGGAWFKI